MKTVKLLLLSMLIGLLTGCLAGKPEKFASDAPVRKIVFDAPFPDDLIYQATPDEKAILGVKELKPAHYEMNGPVIETPIYEISGFDVETARRIWQLPFVGEVIGQTEKQILVYEEKTLTIYFITPRTGEIARKVSPAPNPLSSHNSLKLGMAFNDEVYVTTKALYTSIYNGYGSNRREDESFKIGITAKNWGSDEKLWFVPPVKQIITIETRPVIFGNRVLIINPNYSPLESHSYQIVSLTTGAEMFRGESEGYFYYLDNKFFIEQTKSFTKRIEPLTGKELWRIEYTVQNAFVSIIGSQITIRTNDGTSQRTVRTIDAETGRLLKQFDLPDLQETTLKAAFITKDNRVLLNFDSEVYKSLEKERYNYWVGYDTDSKKVLWRTAFDGKSAGSLFPFASEKMRFE